MKAINASALRGDSRQPALLLLLLLLTVLLYAPGLGGPFLFDDAPNITDNSFLTREKSSLLEWWAAAQSSGSGALRRPLSMLSFAAQIPDGPPASALALKAGNLLIHLLCGCLLWMLAHCLLQAMGRDGERRYRWLPLLATALWLLNPLLLSTVLYPVQRMAQLSALFVLAGLASYAWFRARWATRPPRLDEALALLLWLLLFTLLGALSKENAVLLPWLIAVLEFSLLRGRWNGGYSIAVARIGAGMFLLPLLLVVLIAALQWGWVVRGYEYRSFTVYERLWTESRLLWEYLSWFILPRLGELGLFHDDLQLSRGWLSPATTLLSASGWAVLLFLALWLRGRFPWLLAAVLFYLVGHSMESGFLALELVFEHRNYLPSVALALALAAGLCELRERLRSSGRPALAWTPVLFLLLLFAGSLLSRAASWASEMQLASDSYARHPASQRSAHFYANTLLKVSQKPGMDPGAAADYLALARHEFEALQQRDPLDLSALVMLYTMDSRYFADVADPERWLRGIEGSLETTKLQATEYAAMRVLMACVAEGGCEIPRDRRDAMLSTFARRYIAVDAATDLRLRSLEFDARPPEERVALLEAALAAAPGNLSLYYPIIAAQLELGDYGAAHAAIMRLLGVDRSHRQLAVVADLFAPASGGQDAR